jgi:hypothetical protein
MFVFDTSAYINGWRYHYPPATFGRVWNLIEQGLRDGRILSPRAVFTELSEMDDDLYAWSRDFAGAFVDPSPAVQTEAGAIQALLPKPGVRDVADPWVIAEAKARNLTVVTYEGVTFGGVPTIKANTKMPGICQNLGVGCVILPAALGALGGSGL